MPSSLYLIALTLMFSTAVPFVAGQVPRRELIRKSEQTPAQRKKNLELVASLLDRAAGAAKDLSEADRAFLYARLADASAASAPEKTMAWADEAFQISKSMPDNMQRGQVIMQSTIAASKVDLDRAMQMLNEIEGPRLREGQQIPDMRAGIATMVFQR
jgi:hypothetical protein